MRELAPKPEPKPEAALDGAQVGRALLGEEALRVPAQRSTMLLADDDDAALPGARGEAGGVLASQSWEAGGGAAPGRERERRHEDGRGRRTWAGALASSVGREAASKGRSRAPRA